jgi:hypothetical protein
MSNGRGVVMDPCKRRAAGDRHAAAQRHLFNRMIGILHHCLTNRMIYNPVRAFPTNMAADSSRQ